MSNFQIGERGAAIRAPVDHVLAAVDQSSFIKADEDFTHGARQAFVEGEAFTAPIATGAEANHLALDRAARLFLPFPNALFKLFAAEVAALDTLFAEHALDHHLGSDAGMVCSGKPKRVEA